MKLGLHSCTPWIVCAYDISIDQTGQKIWHIVMQMRRGWLNWGTAQSSKARHLNEATVQLAIGQPVPSRQS
jgi:hypothetical protein